MRLTRLRADSPTKNTCPAIYATDEASVALQAVHAGPGAPSLIVQGKQVTDPEALTALNMPDDETAVEVPVRLLLDLAEQEVSRRDDGRPA